jgi:adenosine kinase
MLIGCIGTDNYGEEIRKGLEKVGVIPLLEISPLHNSSRCAVAIHKKERCLLPCMQASAKLSLEFIIQNMENILEASFLLIEGYLLVNKFDIIKYITNQFTLSHKKVILTLSATVIVSKHYDRMIEIANYSNYIFGNQEEASIFARIPHENDNEKISIEIHKKLKPLDRVLIITCGKGPVVVSKYDYELNKLEYILFSYVYQVDTKEIEDTNGCGDGYVGGFLSQLVQGKSIEKCARAGNWASSVILKNVGCTYPENIEIKKF